MNIDAQIGVSGAVSIRELMKKNEKLKQSAKVNSREDFEFSFEDEIDNALTEGYTQNQDFFGVLLNNDTFKKRIAKLFIDDVYRSLRGNEDSLD